MGSTFQNYVAGEFVDGDSGRSIPVTDPATGVVFAEHALAGPETFEAAVAAGREAFTQGLLTRANPAQRARLMNRIAAELRAVKSDGGRALCFEQGKALSKAEDEFEKAAAAFEYYAGLADKAEGRQIPVGETIIDFTMLEPLGLSLQIVPWNFPVSIAARSIAAAMVTGNSVILKAPELTPIGLHHLARALDAAGVPKGTVSVINALGAEVGEHLIGRDDIDQITFTGSVATGKAILSAAAQNVVPCVMELGGKSAGIALADANIDKVIAAVHGSVITNAGQVCSGMTRLVVHRSRQDEILEALNALSAAVTVGAGIDNADLTPLVSETQRERVIDCVDRGRPGGTIVCGGTVPDRSGFFYDFTVFSDVDPAGPLGQEEVFGPVLSVMAFDEIEEAIEIANATPYGLAAGIFTDRLNDGLSIAKKLRAGQVYGNLWHAGSIAAPFGGFGQSGYGRERGYEAVYNYAASKNIAFSID